jgi:hypothetical protein
LEPATAGMTLRWAGRARLTSTANLVSGQSRHIDNTAPEVLSESFSL